jgi:hypothetical protein
MKKNIVTICVTILFSIVMHYIFACSFVENKNSEIENQDQRFYISRHILVPININGIDADFMLDNGCPETYIDSIFFFSTLFDSTFKIIRPNQLERINIFQYSGKLLIKIDGKECEINNFYVRNLKNNINEKRKGIIGYDLLQDKVLMLDFINYTLKLNEDYSDTGYKKISFIPTQDKHIKLIEAEVFSSNITNHKKCKLIFDLGTGGSVSAIFKQKFLKSLEKDIERIASGTGNSTILQHFSTLWKIDSIEISSFYVKNVSVATLYYTDNYGDPIDLQEGDGLLGCQFFDGFNLIIDFKKNLLFIKNKNGNIYKPE